MTASGNNSLLVYYIEMIEYEAKF